MKYCSECGAEVKLQTVSHEHRQRHVCAGCGTTHYENPRVIVCCSVAWEGTVLMCRRGQEPALGKWTAPSGFLECGETLEEGAARETFEETGVVIDPQRLQLQAIINMVEIAQIAVAFRVDLTTRPVLTPGPECLEVAFLAEADLPAGELAWQQFLGDSTRGWFRQMRSGEHAIYLATLGSQRRHEFKSREYRIESVRDIRGSGSSSGK